MGLREFAGYFAVALSALATGWIASRWGLRPEPFFLGVGFVVLGLLLSVVLVRETRHHVSALVKPSARLEGASCVFARANVGRASRPPVARAGIGPKIAEMAPGRDC